MKKERIIALAVLGVIVLSAAYWSVTRCLNTDSLAIVASGTIEATTVELNARMAGVIKTIKVKAGDTVEKGQPVAELLRNDLVAQRKRDELTVVKAEAALNDLLSGAREQEKAEAAANVNIARANYSRALDDYENAEALFAVAAISRVELDKAKTAAEITKNQLQAATSRLALLESGTRPEQINAARVEVQRSEAVLNATLAMLEDLKIAAPLAGTVITKNYHEGEYVQPGASLATIADLNDLWIKVYIPTDDLPRIQLGQKVKFNVSGVDRDFEGIVDEIATKGEFTPKTIQTKKERTNIVFSVKIRIKNDGGMLKPGMPADVEF